MSPHPLSPFAVSISAFSVYSSSFTNALFCSAPLIYSLHQCIVCSVLPILPSPMHCLLSPTYTPFTNALFAQPHLYSLHQCIVCSVLPILPSLLHCLFCPTYTPSLMHCLFCPTYTPFTNALFVPSYHTPFTNALAHYSIACSAPPPHLSLHQLAHQCIVCSVPPTMP